MPPVLDAIEAARYLGVHPETLKAKAREGAIPAAKIGRQWRFQKEVLDRWLAQGGTLSNAEAAAGLLALSRDTWDDEAWDDLL